jgi:hypothetical protein
MENSWTALSIWLTRYEFLSLFMWRLNNVVKVTLEKRLGIAQLFLLLIVLIFIALTRGSRGEAITITASGRRDSLKAWGRRQLSGFGSDWTSKFRNRSGSSGSDSENRSKDRDARKSRSRSQTPTPAELALRSGEKSKCELLITGMVTH